MRTGAWRFSNASRSACSARSTSAWIVSCVSHRPAQEAHSITSVLPSVRRRNCALQRGQPSSTGRACNAWGWIAIPHSMQKCAPRKSRA